MKTIAVLTDFSKRAENAARYACGLAGHLQASVMLYNTFLLPSAQLLSAQIAWPTEDFEETKSDNEKQLRHLATRLKKDFNDIPVEFQSKKGRLSTHLNELIEQKEVILLVMTNHEGGWTKLMLENHLQEIIESTTVPVMIVPKGVIFSKIHKMTLATDLSDTDLEVLQSLTTLARPFGGDISIAHISTDRAESKTVKAVKGFLSEITAKINYPHVYYRDVIADTIEEGLQWLTGHVVFDILVMIHRDKGFLTRLFNNSYTENMSRDIPMPLLVYPASLSHLPVF
jgi:nucleotide-binding universal stress UspA family protein